MAWSPATILTRLTLPHFRLLFFSHAAPVLTQQNPHEQVDTTLRVPLYYAGLSTTASVSREGAAPVTMTLARDWYSTLWHTTYHTSPYYTLHTVHCILYARRCTPAPYHTPHRCNAHRALKLHTSRTAGPSPSPSRWRPIPSRGLCSNSRVRGARRFCF
jgi:hypothetical protein